MAIDFQQVWDQVKKLGKNAPTRGWQSYDLREKIYGLLEITTNDPEWLCLKVGDTFKTEEVKRVHVPKSIEAWINNNGIHPEAAKGLQPKLGYLFRRSYIVEKPVAFIFTEIIKSLEARQHIALSFGCIDNDLE